MLRWLGFVVLVIVVHRILQYVPGIGTLLARTGLLGFWLAAVVVGLGLQRFGRWANEQRRFGARIRDLQRTDSPLNMGKLGSLLVQSRRYREAIEPLEAAAAAEPEVPEWSYQLGRAHLALGDMEAAASALRTVIALNEEHAFGAAQLRLAEALYRSGSFEESLEPLRVFDRNHGESPESAYRTGLALKKLGRADEARSSFARVAQLAAQAPRYQAASASGWVVRARFASMF